MYVMFLIPSEFVKCHILSLTKFTENIIWFLVFRRMALQQLFRFQQHQKRLIY
jgi:hypothetical protein